MPNIDSIPVPLHTNNQPYHYVIDNLPLGGLIERVGVVNDQVDIDAAILADSCGTAGTLANRLAQSIDDNGDLKAAAVDEANHSIEAHADTAAYVRMTAGERTKLAAVADGATNLGVQFHLGTAGDTTALVGAGTLSLKPSSTIVWRYQGGSYYADWNVPAATQHTHYYGYTARPVNVGSPDYVNYVTASPLLPYKAGTLRVYLNGVRLTPAGNTKVPVGNTPAWVNYSYTEGAATGGVVTGGGFALTAAVDATVRVVIDFDG